MIDFINTWNLFKEDTCVGEIRAKAIFESIKKLKEKNINESLVELGVFRGGITKMIATWCPLSIVHAFDTFEGMPDLHTVYDMPENSKKYLCGNFKDFDFEKLKKDFQNLGNIKIHKGIFPHSSIDIKDEKFMFCHLDFDLYYSCLSAMEFFYPLLVPNGVIIIDDYERPECPGVKKAIDEYCLKNNIKINILEDFQVLVRKK